MTKVSLIMTIEQAVAIEGLLMCAIFNAQEAERSARQINLHRIADHRAQEIARTEAMLTTFRATLDAAKPAQETV